MEEKVRLAWELEAAELGPWLRQYDIIHYHYHLFKRRCKLFILCIVIKGTHLRERDWSHRSSNRRNWSSSLEWRGRR